MEFVRLNSLRELNLVRAVRLVRQSNPRLLMLSIGLIVLQGFVPVVPIYVVKLIVDAVGNVSVEVDGKHVTIDAYQFDDEKVLIPFVHIVNGTDTAGDIELIEWDCGLVV